MNLNTPGYFQRMERLRQELDEAREAIAEATSVVAYDRARMKVAFIQSLLERYEFPTVGKGDDKCGR